MKTSTHLKLVDPTIDTPSSDASDWVVRVRDLGKRFTIYTHDRNRLLEFFGNRKHHEEHWSTVFELLDFAARRQRKVLFLRNTKACAPDLSPVHSIPHSISHSISHTEIQQIERSRRSVP